MNLAVFFFRFGPYHVARLNAVGQRVSLTAIELSGRAMEYAWDPVDAPPTFERVTVFPDHSHREVSRPVLRRRIGAVLDDAAPDAVALPGWDDPGTLAALDACRSRDIPRVVMSASSALDAPRTWWREAVKEQVVRSYDAGLVGGTRHADYLQSLGMPTDRTFTGYNVVDNAHFADGAVEARSHADARREALDLPDRYFLAIGRFIPKKNFARLLDAFARYRTEAADPWDLVLLGDGPLDADLRAQRADLGLTESVHLPGFRQYPELPAYYGLAGAFVHPSLREQWGLVVNEAMAAGLPVAVSDRCGCVPDLVDPGRNGVTFDPNDTDALVRSLRHLSSDRADRASMGAASEAIIADWTPDHFATQLLRAADAAIRHRQSHPSTSWMRNGLIHALMRR